MDKETIFAEALTKETPEERRQFLETVCAENRELLQEIEALLAAHEDAGSFLNKTPEEFVLTADSGKATAEENEWDEDAWRELLEPSDNPEHLGKLGPYEVIEVLGRGGFGIVLRAHDSKLHRAVAIKLLAPQLALTGSAVQRFLREAQSTAAVSHNHVIAIHSIDYDSRPPMIVMEYVEGQSLQQKIDSTGALDVKSILRIGLQTAGGLAAAHQQGLVHRDIKPANILLENGIERVKLTDFGLARAVDDIGMTRTGQITGTPQYMSPEQAQGQRVDHRTDLFSLGCVMYAMCTGRAAFRADSAMAVMNRVVNDTPRPIREINPDIPVWLCEIVDKLLAKKPENRFQTAEEVAKLLGDHLAHLQQPDSVPQPERIGQSGPSEVERVVLSELEKGMVPAIRAYRKQTGAGLADARNAVEQIAREHDIEIPTLTPRQRVKQTAITTVTVAVLAWAAATAIEKGVSTFLVTPAFAVVVAVYLMYLIAMWRGSRMDRKRPAAVSAADPHDQFSDQRRATEVLTVIGLLDLFLVPLLFLWNAPFLEWMGGWGPLFAISCVALSPACGLFLLLLTLVGRRFHVAERTLSRETGLAASFIALLPVGLVHILSLPVSIWSRRVFYRARQDGAQVSRPVLDATGQAIPSRATAPGNRPLMYLIAVGVLLVAVGAEINSGMFSRGWLKLIDRGQVTLYLANESTEVYRVDTSTRDEERMPAHPVMRVKSGSYHIEWTGESGGIGSMPDLMVSPGVRISVGIPESATTVVVRGPLPANGRIARGDETNVVGESPQTVTSSGDPAFAQLADTWDYKQGQEPVRCLDVSPNGKYLVSGHGPVGGQAHVWLWDVGKNFQNDSFAGGDGVKLDAGVNVTDVRFSPNSQFYAWTQDDGYLGRRLTETNHSNTESFLPVPGALFCLAWSPDGSWIVTGGEGRLHVWDAAAEWKNNQKTSPIEEIPVIARLAGGKTNVLAVAFSPDGQHLAVGCADSGLHLFEVKGRSLVQSGSLHQYSDGNDDNGAVWSIAWAPDGKSIEYGCENGTIQKRMIDGRGWGMHGGLTTEAQVRHYNPVAYSPDGSLIATSEGDSFDREGIPQTYRLSFRSLNGGPRLSARGENHTGEISCLDFTDDGKYLISGSEDGTIKWWEFAKPLVKKN